MVVLNLSFCGLNGVNLAFGLCSLNHMVVKICEGSTVHGSLKSGILSLYDLNLVFELCGLNLIFCLFVVLTRNPNAPLNLTELRRESLNVIK